MTSRWNDSEMPQGIRVLRLNEVEPARKVLVLSRQPRNWMYQPRQNFAGCEETEEELATYGERNNELHENIARVARDVFALTPWPSSSAPGLQESVPDPGLEEFVVAPIGTAFTYQNWDWYGPTYYCPVVVLKDYISAQLLKHLQHLLQNRHSDWGIVVIPVSDWDETAADDAADDERRSIYIFSDQVLVAEETARSIGLASTP